MTIVTQYSKGHRLFIFLEFLLLLLPVTYGYALTLYSTWDWQVSYLRGEFDAAPEFFVAGLFLWSAWVITLAASKSPSALASVRSLWWWLSGIACLTVLGSWAIFLGDGFGLSWAHPSVAPAWISFSILGSPLLPLAIHCWHLRGRSTL